MSETFLSMIQEVESKIGNHLPSLMLCRWATIRAERGLMTVRDYWTFKAKLGMGF